MQGIIKILAEKAGRHVLQLLTLLKENMLARVALFTVICALIFLAFTVIDGLGDSSQAITAFSEGTLGKENKPDKVGFKEIKGMKEVQEYKGMYNPFEETKELSGDKKNPRKGDIKEGGNTSSAKVNKGEGKVKNTDNKKTSFKGSPKIKGIMEGNKGPSVLLEYGGSQYMLSPGDVVDNIFVESVDNNSVRVNVQGRIMCLER